jgi:hypothetical protein
MAFLAFVLPLSPLASVSPETSERRAVNKQEHSWASWEETLSCSLLQQGRTTPAHVLCATLSDEYHPLALRITTLGEMAMPSVPLDLSALTTRLALRVGGQCYHVREVLLSGTPWAGLSTWADLLSPPHPPTIWLHLGSPLVLPKGPSVVKGRVYHFPAPRPVFAELAERWQELGGPPLPMSPNALLPLLEDGSIVLTAYHLRARAMQLDGSVRASFSGWLSYQCRAPSEALRATFVALARFAFFAGVGTETARGMGATRISFA